MRTAKLVLLRSKALQASQGGPATAFLPYCELGEKLLCQPHQVVSPCSC
jgi:hypothetical protein